MQALPQDVAQLAANLFVQLRLLTPRPFQSPLQSKKRIFRVAFQRLSELNSRLRLGSQDVSHAGVATGRGAISLRTYIG